MTQERWLVYSKRVVQGVFGNMVQMGNRMDSHPRTHCTHISGIDLPILLLESVYCLKGLGTTKS
jgi:hypothetical protein